MLVITLVREGDNQITFNVLLERIEFLQLVVDFYLAFCGELERLNGILAVTDV